MRFFSFFERTFTTTKIHSTSIGPRHTNTTTTESSRSKGIISREEENNQHHRGIFDQQEEDRSPGCMDEESLAVSDDDDNNNAGGGGNGAGAVKESASSGNNLSGADKGDAVEESIMTKDERAPVVTLEVDGMTCAVCVGIVENLLKRVPGVKSADVSLPLERATVVYSPELTSPEQLVEAVEDGGYEAKLCAVEEEEDEEEMAENVEKKAAKMRAAIKSARNIFLVSLIFSVPVVVISMGFDDNSEGTVGTFLNRRVVPGLAVRAVFEWALATPVQFGCGARFYKATYHDLRNRAMGMNFLVASGTSAAYLYSVVLVVLGISTKEEDQPMLFFETSAVLISFILLGKLLELFARGRASNAVGKLIDLRADRAVLVSDWPTCELKGEIDMDASDLAVGDVVKVVRGSKIPADGVVLRGNAAVNESMVTGESMPVHKEEGSDVIGATVCSEGLVYVKVTRTGKNSALHQIIRLVEQAQGSKAPIQEFGDRVASVFVPTVACISLLTLVVWLTLTLSGAVSERWYRDLPGSPGPGLFSFMFALAVMVIACPCAVGLAAPTALLVGMGMSARHGVLIKGGAALQRVSELKRVVFDKTGTLTVGKPRVTEVAYLESEGLHKALLSGKVTKSENVTGEVLRLVASAERSSEHPLAKAIVEFHSLSWAKGQQAGADATTKSADPSQELEMPAEGSTQAVSGRGLSCTVAGLEVSVGSPSYIEKIVGKPLTALPELIAGSLESSGRTVVVAAIERQFAALFGLVDTLRPEAKEVVSELERMGLEVWMLTGDNRRAAHEVARRAGLPADRVCAEVLPGDKASKVEELQKDGKAVAMVGDGINDAPALATADVGIAVGGGTDVAVESADVVLMGSSLWDVLTSLDLSKTIVNRVRINYFWALLYNTIGIPVAAGVFFPVLKVTLPPELAGGAMALSSVSVVLSSLALRLYRPPLAARKATRAAAKSAAKERSSLDQGPAAEDDPVTIWTVDSTCDYPCCRRVVAVQQGAITDTDESEASAGELSKAKAPKEEFNNSSNSSSYQLSVGMCCGSDTANAVVASDHIIKSHQEEEKKHKRPKEGKKHASYLGGGAARRSRCGDPEMGGDKWCSCTCSFCRCVRAIEP